MRSVRKFACGGACCYPAAAMRLPMFWPLLGQAQAPTFTKIVDTTTAIPGGTGNFTGFNSPSGDGVDVAFLGFG